MATIVAAQTGNWSSTSTWTGGVLPGVNDVARINGAFTVTIDQNISVQSLESNHNSGIFLVPSAVNIVCSQDIIPVSIISSTNGVLSISANSGTVNVTADHVYFRNLARAISITGSCNVNISANFVGDTSGTSDGSSAVMISGAATVVISGTVQSVTRGSVFVIPTSSQANLTLNMNLSTLSVSSATGGFGALVCYGTNNSIVINGDVTGSSNTNTAAIIMGANQTGSNIVINGDVVAGSGSYAILGLGSNSGSIVVNGAVESSGSNPAIQSPSAGLSIAARSAVWGSGTAQPVYSPNFRLIPNTNHSIQMRDANNAVVTLSNFSENQPAFGDVRQGVTYGPGFSNTGTLIVPDPSTVAKNVPVDDTVGTATLFPEDVWGHEISSGIEAKDRLLANATNAGVAAQLEAALSG